MSCTLSAESYLQNCRQELKTKNSSYRSIWLLWAHSVYICHLFLQKRKKKKKKKKKKKEKKKKREKEKRKKKNKASRVILHINRCDFKCDHINTSCFHRSYFYAAWNWNYAQFQENCWSTFWSCPKYQAKSYQVTKTKACHSIWLVTLLTLYILTETGNTKRCFGCH